jgi:hypothetical protein
MLLAAVLYWLLHLHVQPKATIDNGASKVTHFNPQATKKIHISEPLFTVDLPADWKTKGEVTRPYHFYMFQGTNPSSRLLSIYIDNIQTNLALNRVLPVQAQGNQIGHDVVSDNCSQFVSPSALKTAEARQQKIADAQWQQVQFRCDIGNFQRDMVGTSAEKTPNQVFLTGPTVGRHPVFFLYTDNSFSPDFSPLYGIIESFHLK